MKIKTSLKVSSPKEHSKLMAEVAGEIAKEKGYKKILDMGTGTGYIALLLYEKGFEAEGCDISHHSVKLARENSKGKNLPIFQSDLFSNVQKKYDIILFNPPASGKAGENPLSNLIRKTRLRKSLSAVFYKLTLKKRFQLILKFLKDAKNFINEKGMILIYMNPEELGLIKQRLREDYNLFRINHKKTANNLIVVSAELK